MTQKFIPVENAFRVWEQDPEFRVAYDARAEEFALALSCIDADRDKEQHQESQIRAGLNAPPKRRERD